MRAWITILAILAIVCAGAAFFFFTGRYDVAATSPHWAITLEALETVRDQSIKRHSMAVTMPQQSLADPELREMGFHHYHDMCRLCHGAPGYEREEFARGLYPRPPQLISGAIQKEWSGSQLYWIVAEGLKMTGMPSFRVTHSRQEMWGIVAFVRHLPDLKPDEYRSMVESAAMKTEQEEQHHHANEAPGAGHD